MKVKHYCGHEVDVPSCNAWWVRSTLCEECRKLQGKLADEQQRIFRQQVGGKEMKEPIV
jgi:hypothetical protein